MRISNRLFLNHSFKQTHPCLIDRKEKKIFFSYDFFSFRSIVMIFLWFFLIFFLKNFSLFNLQTIDIIHNLPNKTVDLFTSDHLHITILGALTNTEHIQILNEHTNQLYRVSPTQEIYLSSQSFILDLNPLLIAIKLCEIGNISHAKAIIAGRGLDGNDLTLTAISYVSDFYHIPVLTIASRENLFSDKVKMK
jgi:hypothetical protein